MKLSLALPEPLVVEVELAGMDGARSVQTFCIRPATRAQVKAALALDIQDGDDLDALKLESIRGKQTEILARESGRVLSEDPLTVDWNERMPLEQLTGEQCTELNVAILQHHLGQDPALALAVRRAVKKKTLVERYLVASASTPKPSASPSISGSLPPQPSSSAT